MCSMLLVLADVAPCSVSMMGARCANANDLRKRACAVSSCIRASIGAHFRERQLCRVDVRHCMVHRIAMIQGGTCMRRSGFLQHLQHESSILYVHRGCRWQCEKVLFSLPVCSDVLPYTDTLYGAPYCIYFCECDSCGCTCGARMDPP